MVVEGGKNSISTPLYQDPGGGVIKDLKILETLFNLRSLVY